MNKDETDIRDMNMLLFVILRIDVILFYEGNP